jgi:hypothetical protein
MKSFSGFALRLLTILLVATPGVPAQTPQTASTSSTAPLQSDPPVEVLGFKIASDYYPMLDSKNSMFTADNPDFPRPETERIAGQGSRRRGRMEDSRSQGKLRSRIKVIGEADSVNLSIKNTGTKLIKAIEWDFAFPRYVNGQMVLRYDVSTKVEIKPGAKKSLKQPLPLGASRCKIVNMDAENIQEEKAKINESICGPGIHDPSYLKQETVTIKRIEYADGSVWKRQ